MTIILHLDPTTEAHLTLQATAQGISVETYLMILIQKDSGLQQPDPLSTSWKTALQSLGHSPSLAKAQPLSSRAISREAIYAEREDHQR